MCSDVPTCARTLQVCLLPRSTMEGRSTRGASRRPVRCNVRVRAKWRTPLGVGCKSLKRARTSHEGGPWERMRRRHAEEEEMDSIASSGTAKGLPQQGCLQPASCAPSQERLRDVRCALRPRLQPRNADVPHVMPRRSRLPRQGTACTRKSPTLASSPPCLH